MTEDLHLFFLRQQPHGTARENIEHTLLDEAIESLRIEARFPSLGRGRICFGWAGSTRATASRQMPAAGAVVHQREVGLTEQTAGQAQCLVVQKLIAKAAHLYGRQLSASGNEASCTAHHCCTRHLRS